ncbi:MAG: metal ABC transporter ATP-binding protein [Candidatus Nealsonbacteria bacterium]
MNPIIETKNVSVRYGQTEALKDISFAIEQGDFVCLAGPNGAGKTTLIKAVLGLLPVSKGEIELFGKTKEKFNDWCKIGYLPQKFSTINALFPATVNEVVMLGLLSQKKFPKRITASDQKKVNDILQKLSISDLKKRMLLELSGGQQQKVLLARALVSSPEILIFDEPSTALDPESRASFFQLIQKLNKQNGIAIILITHDTGYIGQYANKLLYIDRSLIYFGKFSDFCASEKMNSM